METCLALRRMFTVVTRCYSMSVLQLAQYLLARLGNLKGMHCTRTVPGAGGSTCVRVVTLILSWCFLPW